MKFLTALACICLLPLSFAFADRPTAPQLFPDATYAYLRVDDASDLIAKWNQTSSGKLFADPEVRPLVQEMYGSILNSTESLKLEERLGMTIEECLEIFNGEAAIGLMPGPVDAPPTVCFMIEAKGKIEQLNKLLQSALEQSNVHARVAKKVSGIELVDCVPSAQPNEGFAYFINQDVLVGSNSREGLEVLARVWAGQDPEHKPLSNKPEFLQIMTRCSGMQGERPQVSFYIDPYSMAKDLSKSSPGSPIVFAMLTSLGVDGIKGIGGSFIFAPNDFDSITHMHLLMSSPRRVVLSAVRPKEGPIDPETWVNEDAASYLSLNWQTQPTIDAVKELIDTFNGVDFFDESVIKKASDELGLDFRADVLGQLDGRFTMASYFVRPLRINSQSTVYSVKLKNASKFRNDTLPKLVAFFKKNGRWEELQHGSHQIFHMPVSQPENAPRIPDPAFTVFDDSLLASDSLQALQEACDTFDSGTNLLLDSIEYKLIKQRITSQTKGAKVFGLMISRPEESLRTFYDMAADPKNKEKLGEIAGPNPILRALHNSLTKHPLPSFESIRKHLSPGGGYMTEDDSGLHMTMFGIKRKK
jgi:hypothetical protein